MRWLEEIRNKIATVFRVSLSLTEGVSSDAPLEGVDEPDRQRRNMQMPWLVVGRFDPQETVGYEALGRALGVVSDDLALEVWIHPQRVSQIRVVYADPHSMRGEGDSILSALGPWAHIVSELERKVAGAGPGDEDSLAARYKDTRVPVFYVYFSSQVMRGDRNLWETWRIA